MFKYLLLTFCLLIPQLALAEEFVLTQKPKAGINDSFVINDVDIKQEEEEPTVEKPPTPSPHSPAKPAVRKGPVITADMHSHKCGKCGYEFWHKANSPSHICPNCGSGPYYRKYRTRPPANLIQNPQKVYYNSNGCPNGNCSTRPGILGRIFGS